MDDETLDKDDSFFLQDKPQDDVDGLFSIAEAKTTEEHASESQHCEEDNEKRDQALAAAFSEEKDVEKGGLLIQESKHGTQASN